MFPDDRFAAVYGRLRTRLTASGRSIAATDLLIATSAVVEGVPLLTGNRRRFEPLSELEVRSY